MSHSIYCRLALIYTNFRHSLSTVFFVINLITARYIGLHYSSSLTNMYVIMYLFRYTRRSICNALSQHSANDGALCMTNKQTTKIYYTTYELFLNWKVNNSSIFWWNQYHIHWIIEFSSSMRQKPPKKIGHFLLALLFVSLLVYVLDYWKDLNQLFPKCEQFTWFQCIFECCPFICVHKTIVICQTI